MISTATPLRKPVITELETKRTRKPSLNRPASSWIRPTSSTMATSACAFWSEATFASPAPAATDSALVVETFMKTELVKSAPMGTAIIRV